jgi:signal transduction histidine kinase
LKSGLKSASFLQRLLIGFGLIFAVSAIVDIAAYRIVGSLINTNHWVEHTQDVRSELKSLLYTLEDAETGQRGYLLTGNPAYLEPYQAALNNVAPRLQHLIHLTADNGEQQREIPRLRQAIQSKLDEVNRTIQLYQEHRYEDARHTVLSDEGKRRMDNIRGIVEKMLATENRLLQQRTGAASISAQRTLLVLTVSLVLILVSFLLTFFLIRRYFRERAQAEAERTHLLRTLVTLQEDERRRISRELHDELGQYLTALLLGLDAAIDGVPAASPARTQIQRLQQFSKQVGQDIHRIAWELRPTSLDDLGLEIALRNYLEEWSERAEVSADFHSNGLTMERLPADIETTLYRVAQEALTNVARHARASRVSLILERFTDHIAVIIEDDGIGMNTELVSGRNRVESSIGLIGIKERVALVGGAFTLESTPGRGTTLFVRIPLVVAQERAVHG